MSPAKECVFSRQRQRALLGSLAVTTQAGGLGRIFHGIYVEDESKNLFIVWCIAYLGESSINRSYLRRYRSFHWDFGWSAWSGTFGLEESSGMRQHGFFVSILDLKGGSFSQQKNTMLEETDSFGECVDWSWLVCFPLWGMVIQDDIFCKELKAPCMMCTYSSP